MYFRFRNSVPILAALMSAALVFGNAVSAQTPTLELTRVATGLSNPIFATYAPGDTSRMFIAEQGGNIRILDLSSGSLSTFMTTANLTAAGNGFTSGGEQGLLGLAFDPNYANNRRFYVNYTGTGGTTFVRSFVTQAGNPNLVDGNNGAANIISYAQPFSNHNGGWMGFGPDNQLYISAGDGGSGNDPGNRALDRNSLLGKILRISPDVSSAGGYAIPSNNPLVGVAGTRGEIWAYGLRNPWRPSFDRQTGDFYIADVGQNAREEINFQAAGSAGGQNYGWRQFEGTGSTGLSGQPGTAPDTKPIYQYNQSATNGRSITGGYVYRGPLEALQGQYFYGDYVGRTLLSFKFDGSDPSSFNGNNIDDLINWTFIARDPSGASIRGNWSSFAEDAQGNLYAIDLASGNMYRFTAASVPEPGMTVLFVVGGLVASLRRRRQMS